MILAGSTAFAQTATMATISGSVVDDSGSPIPGAVVIYHNSPKTQWDKSGHRHLVERLVASSVKTGADGTFIISSLPAGSYFLCAAGIKPTHLRSCDWGNLGTSADLTTASAVIGVKLHVRDGVLLTYQVTDPFNRIQDPTFAPGKAIPPGNFRIFAVQGTHYMVAGPLSASISGNVHQYALAVPKTATIRTHLDTSLKLLNQLGASILNRTPTAPITVSGQPVTVILSVQ